MAAHTNRAASQLLSVATRKIIGTPCVVSAVPVRRMAQRAAISNKPGRTVGKRLGWKRQDGAFVHAGEQLVKQKAMRFYPGENVEFKRGNSLYAMTDGNVMVTAEQLSPFPDSPMYAPVQEGAVIYKKFFHVVPTPLRGKFRLVSET
ncbi:50S ribosomal protein L27-like [Haliotis rufescens]|uniref:50S ribosomal protein L27-like n=1 Tax=Haliotis rufescens TaxID=6454 RepID=UPI001EB05D1B|nr:50S ribosomal protein L27-like [Haliotis rufescens]